MTVSELVKRLRTELPGLATCDARHLEAADEIERLTAEVDALRVEIDQLHDQWYSPEHMDAVQKRTIDPLLKEKLTEKNKGQEQNDE